MCNVMEFYHIPVFLLVDIFIGRDVYEGNVCEVSIKVTNLQVCSV
jgi:hypothetical protein